MIQDNISVQMAGVYQFLLHVHYLGVSHGTSAVTATMTVLTTVTRPDAPVSLLSNSQSCLYTGVHRKVLKDTLFYSYDTGGKYKPILVIHLPLHLEINYRRSQKQILSRCLQSVADCFV